MKLAWPLDATFPITLGIVLRDGHLLVLESMDFASSAPIEKDTRDKKSTLFHLPQPTPRESASAPRSAAALWIRVGLSQGAVTGEKKVIWISKLSPAGYVGGEVKAERLWSRKGRE